ncbi:hypothetical protein PAHAL_2G301100 [Panicum hallii]|uniref:Uncharacterized protein n=1 Tax=Panicum hallii TaxID=206008 RepID=A0A2T8KR08_9POAL|nr:hypothetical protein PAHAL_2G301100 [Panicum hallii]
MRGGHPAAVALVHSGHHRERRPPGHHRERCPAGHRRYRSLAIIATVCSADQPPSRGPAPGQRRRHAAAVALVLRPLSPHPACDHRLSVSFWFLCQVG